MNSALRIIGKLFLTLIIIIFFGGVFRGCSAAAQTGAGKSIGLLFATATFFAVLWFVWRNSSKK